MTARRFVLLFLLVLFYSVVTPGQPRPGQDIQTKSLDLREALSLALTNNKEIEISRQNVRIAEFELSRVKDRSSNNTYAVEAAKRSIELADAKFRQVTIDVITKLQFAYWDLGFAIQDLQLQANGLELARTLLRQNEELLVKGQLFPIDRTVVEVQISNQELANYDTKATLIQAENALKYLMAANSGDPLWNVSLIPTGRATELSGTSLSIPDALTAAMENRPELKINKIAVELNQIAQKSYAGKKEQQASLGKSLVEAQQLKTQREQLELQIQVEVRNAIQKFRNADARYLAARSARQALEQLYSDEEKKFRTGVTNTTRILEMQTLLLDARLRELRSSTELAKTWAELQQVTGTSLSSR